MALQSQAATLRSLRQELAAVIARTEYYGGGHADWGIENAIYAAHKRAEMADKLRGRAANLRVLIAAYEKTDA
jgi:hypothetical protein